MGDLNSRFFLRAAGLPIIPIQCLRSPGGLALRVREDPFAECETEGFTQVPTLPLVRRRASVLVTQGFLKRLTSQFLMLHQLI